MATQEEIQKQKELNAELEKTAQLRRDSLDISSSLIDSLRETLGLQNRRTTFENNVLGVNKQIYQALLNQKTGLIGIDALSKQIAKNNEIIEKSSYAQSSLANGLSEKRKKEADQFVKNILCKKL